MNFFPVCHDTGLSRQKNICLHMIDGMECDPAVIKSAVLRLAKDLGFSACRVAPAVRAPHADVFLEWLQAGRHGAMAWLERDPERRCQPDLVLPGCQSIICLSCDYGGGCHLPQSVALYARGMDYHKLMGDKLEDLCHVLEMYGGQQRWYVDTGPVLEREYAELAGIGWRGRHGLIVRERGGSFFFLGVILSTLQLPCDAPVKNRCGSCRRCLVACPTGALMGDGTMDARRCISYLTIENKEGIPEDLRPAIGSCVYGCDLCQMACPWNTRSSLASTWPVFFPSNKLRNIQWRNLLSLSEEDFSALFRLSPIRRIKRRGLWRNICVVLGNVGNYEDWSALRHMHFDDSMVAEHAAWAIRQLERRLGMK